MGVIQPRRPCNVPAHHRPDQRQDPAGVGLGPLANRNTGRGHVSSIAATIAAASSSVGAGEIEAAENTGSMLIAGRFRACAWGDLRASFSAS
jgi:hypothetical protein